ncbi:MAG: branched-chain amino acid ABC transporter permease [Acidobacteriota bacterium]|jgi:branched-chain amino acid transport system permease protein
MTYLLHVATMIVIYTMLACSLNLLAGYCGLVSIAHAAFYGFGAYVGALLAIRFGCDLLVEMACVTLVVGMVALLVGWPALRILDDYFVLVTFALQAIAFGVFNNCVSLTGGPLGLPGIPPPSLLGWRVSTHLGFLGLTSLFCMITLAFSFLLVRSPIGRILVCVREDEVFAKVLGKDVVRVKISLFMISACFAAVAGVIYAHYTTFIDPTSFTINESIFVISIVIIGGAGSLSGPIVGAVILVTLPEVLRFAGLPSDIAANSRQIIYGTVIVVMMMFRPQGLLGKYRFER